MSADGSGESTTKKICVACNKEFSHGETTCPNDGTALTTIKDNNFIGTVLGGRYEIEEKLGSGAMGEVYRAKHRLMKRQVAIKVMHPQTISGSNALKRFQKEAEMASALNHPNILAVHDFGVSDDGSPYLVMNYLEGQSLTDLIDHNGHLDVPRALHIFRQLCQGLGHAHEKGVIHRDLKPSNIMLVTLDQDPDFVQILDFGIAKQLTPETNSDSLTRTGEVFGSPHYMSPEQCRALPVDGRSDIYALGCVMYRVLTGYAPLMGGDLVECLYKHVNEMPAPFSEICPEYNLPDDLEAVIFKAVAKKPEDRYQTMADLKQGLESVEAYKAEVATKTYGSLGGVSASATLTSLPASAIISYIGQSTANPATATSTQTPATTDSAAIVIAAAGPATKPKATQTGDLPAMQAAAISANQNSATASGDFSSSMNTNAGSSANGQDGSARAEDSSRTSADGSVHTTGTVAAPASAAGGKATGSMAPIKNLLAKLSPKMIVPAAVAAALFVVSVAVALLSPSGDAKIEALQKQAKISIEKGQYRQAEQKIRAAIDEAKNKSLPDSEMSLYLLGDIQYAEGDYSNAVNSLETALKLRTTKYGANSKEEAEVQALLGLTLTAMGNYHRAEQLLQKSYQTRHTLFGDNSKVVADSLTGLGYLHVSENSFQKAIGEHTNALKIIQAATGEDSPEAASALCNLGEDYQRQLNWTQAEALYKQALAIRKKKLDGNSVAIADNLKRLASVSLAEGNLMQAKTYLEQALSIQEKSLGSASPQVAQTRQDLASVNNRLSGRRHK